MRLHGDVTFNGRAYSSHAVLDVLGVRDDDTRRSRSDYGYLGVSLAVYAVAHLLER
jgi:hypothetical protein